MDGIAWVTHKGKEILVFNFCEIAEGDFHQQISKVESAIQSTTQKDILKLSIVNEERIGTNALLELKTLSDKYDSLIKKEAIIGLSGLRRLLLKATQTMSNKEVASFDNIEKAKDWLVE